MNESQAIAVPSVVEGQSITAPRRNTKFLFGLMLVPVIGLLALFGLRLSEKMSPPKEYKMTVKTKITLAAGIAALLVLSLIAGGWFLYTAYAQGATPWAYGFNGGCHNNQAVLDLLKISESDLNAQRQAGRSLLDIGAAKGVSEQQLTEALLQPITAMHAWMSQSQIPEAQRRGNYPQSNADQMTKYMRDWIAKDIREAKFGTMTDFRLFGGNGTGLRGGANGMMNGVNGYGGMMGGRNGYGGMMTSEYTPR